MAQDISKTQKLIDSKTGELTAYSPVTTWEDGTAMTDAKVDGIIYTKRGGVFYRRNFTGPVNVKWFGAKGDGVTDDTESISAAINFAKSILPKTVYIPKGLYLYSTLPNLAASGLSIEGESLKTTSLKCTRVYAGGGTQSQKNNAAAIVIDAWASGSPNDPYVDTVNIKELYIQGNNTIPVGIFTQGIARSVWENVYIGEIEPTQGIGLYFGSHQLSNFKNVGVSAVLSFFPQTSIPYEGLRLVAGTRAGQGEGNCSNNVFNGCYFEGLSIGIRVAEGDQNTFIGGAPEGNSVYGCLVGPTSRYNSFIGVGFENKHSIDVSDTGEYTKYYSCYMASTGRIGGKGIQINGGYYQRIEIQSGGINNSIQDINIGNWTPNPANPDPLIPIAGVYDSGLNTSIRNVWDKVAATMLKSLVKVDGSIKASSIISPTITDDTLPFNPSDANGSMQAYTNSASSVFPLSKGGVGLAIDRAGKTWTGTTGIGSLRIWTSNDSTRDYYVKKQVTTGVFSPWDKFITDNNAVSSIPLGTTTTQGLLKKSAALTAPTATDLPTAIARLEDLIAKLQAAGIQT